MNLWSIPACVGCCEGKGDETCWFLKQRVSTGMNEMKTPTINTEGGKQLGSASCYPRDTSTHPQAQIVESRGKLRLLTWGLFALDCYKCILTFNMKAVCFQWASDTEVLLRMLARSWNEYGINATVGHYHARLQIFTPCDSHLPLRHAGR